MARPWPAPQDTGLHTPCASFTGDSRGSLTHASSCTLQRHVLSLSGSSVPGTGLQVPKEYMQSSFHCNKDCIVQSCTTPLPIPSLSASLFPLHLLPGHPALLSLLDIRTGSKWLTLAISLLQKGLGTQVLLQVEDRMGLSWFGLSANETEYLCLVSSEALQLHKSYQE